MDNPVPQLKFLTSEPAFCVLLKRAWADFDQKTYLGLEGILRSIVVGQDNALLGLLWTLVGRQENLVIKELKGTEVFNLV